MIWEIWLIAGVAYLLFSAWYFNWKGPVKAAEIEEYVRIFEEEVAHEHTSIDVLRKFLEEDDGKEFVMLNLVRLHQGKIEHPLTKQKQNARSLLQGYFKPFSKALLKRGGHPVFQARKIGGHIDSWNAADDEGFTATAMMRYRSRRDLIELTIDPAFKDIHIYKLAAIEKTISFPTQYLFSMSLRPAKAVPILLILIASIAQNITALA